MKSKVVVIGAGGAGLVAALSAHESGAEVVVVTKEYPTRSQTCMAQGGINAVLHDKEGKEGDSVETHIQNTLKSANALANERAVRYMCEEAPDAIRWLDGIGVCFSRTKESQIAQRKLGGAYGARACYAQDYTGLKILHTLYDRSLAEGIEILNERYLLELLTRSDESGAKYICGVSLLNKRSGEVEIVEASSVILATGGYARVYERYSTNSFSSTGDGIAAALRAGARVSDMEFVQFHPTALKGSSILISESARGAGGHLLNSKGERFVDELLPRDEVSKAIHDEIQKGEDIYLDIRHLGAEFIEKELPQEAKLAKLYENVDPAHDLIPIKPAAHYTMGGVDVDDNSSTSINGLFAAGECANRRVHGANRLGGNSLLELVVFGKQAGINAAKYAKDFKKEIDAAKERELFEDKIAEIKRYTNEIDFYEKRAHLGELFYKNVGIKRDKKTLQEALEALEEMIDALPKMGIGDKTKEYNTNLIEFLEFKNMLLVAESIILGAISRQESRGAHFRSDFPNKDEKYSAHTVIDAHKRVSYEN